MSSQQHSRLGQILINKGLINRGQLDAAIQQQLTSQKRLGEVLIEQGWLTERQLKKALSKQTNLRLAATLIAALLSPFQIASADAPRVQASISQEHAPHGLRPLTDLEMSNVSAQGLDDVLQGLFLQAGSGDGLDTVAQLSKLVMPVLSSLEAETSMKDVRYDTSKLTSAINADGSVNVRLPSSIGELRFDNIRVAGAPQGQSFGNLSLQDIDLSQASLKISIH
ncbi:MAG: hypothetical protein VCA57_05370 [Pseudomonas sp.]|uniref:hypothetical protein n=1 Tax=Pseudomonas sp. TaxID=306 RepID=UPI003981FFE6